MAVNNSVKGLAHIGVFTTNLEESIQFYTEVLGFTLTYQKDLVNPAGTTRLGFVDVGGLIIELIQPSDPAGVVHRKNGMIDHIAIEVTEIDVLIQRLKERGVAFETEEKVVVEALYQGITNIFLSGPSGERLEFFQYNQ